MNYLLCSASGVVWQATSKSHATGNKYECLTSYKAITPYVSYPTVTAKCKQSIPVIPVM